VESHPKFVKGKPNLDKKAGAKQEPTVKGNAYSLKQITIRLYRQLFWRQRPISKPESKLGNGKANLENKIQCAERQFN
jgi:hypothetical protein